MNNKVAILLGSENDMKYVDGSYKYFDFFKSYNFINMNNGIFCYKDKKRRVLFPRDVTENYRPTTNDD